LERLKDWIAAKVAEQHMDENQNFLIRLTIINKNENPKTINNYHGCDYCAWGLLYRI
jgi:hypothetical protein